MLYISDETKAPGVTIPANGANVTFDWKTRTDKQCKT
jgi:hypothetical protein